MNYNKTGLIVLLISVFFSFAFFAYLIFFSSSMDLAELEVESALPKDKSAVSVDLSQVKELWIFNDLLVAHGSRVYQTYCASCHGKTGLGDGLAAAGLRPAPRNLVDGDWKKGGDSMTIYRTLVEGIEGSSMVSFSYLSKLDRWALVHYVRSITKNKVKDDIEKLKEFAKTAK